MPDTVVDFASGSGLHDVLEGLLAAPPGPELQSLLAGADEWALGLDAARLLDGVVRQLRPASILEFGAGRSSLVIAAALQSCGGGHLTSIEHQPQYARDSWRRMVGYPAVDALMLKAGLAVRLSRLGVFHQYTGIAAALAERAPDELVLIDAPPGHLGRDATLLAAAPYLAPGALAILDDATRPGERTAVRRWTRALDIDVLLERPDFGRGILVLRVASPRAPSFAWRTFAGSVQDRLLEIGRILRPQ